MKGGFNLGRYSKCDFSDLKELKNKIDNLQKNDFNHFCEVVAKELASRLLAKVIKRTPVGEYPASTGKVGGTLRRGWTGNKTSNAKTYAESLPITKSGNMIQIEIVNPTEYASYVEYGHRTRNHAGWVKGRFMLTISESELESQSPKIVERKLMEYLKGIL